MKILFVCLGNICRSPMAEGLFRSLAPDTYTLDSAATSNWNTGQPPHKGTRDVLAKHNISDKMMQARQITTTDFLTSDLILAMDQSNIDDLKAIAPVGTQDKIHLFMEPVIGFETLGVPDPWYTGDFEETERLILKGTQAWLHTLK